MLAALDCFVACAPRNDVSMKSRSRGEFRPSLGSCITLLKHRGRREGRVAAVPGAPAQRKFARAREPQVQAVTTGLPCAVVLRLIRALPGEPAFATVIFASITLART